MASPMAPFSAVPEGQQIVDKLVLSVLAFHKALIGHSVTIEVKQKLLSVAVENLKSSLNIDLAFPTTLHAIVNICIGKDHAANKLLIGSKGSPLKELCNSMNLQFFKIILEAVERSLAVPRLNPNVNAEERIGAGLPSLLPALRLYSTWLLVNLAPLAYEGSSITCDEFWKQYARTVTALHGHFHVQELAVPVLYLFEEDLLDVNLDTFQTAPQVEPRFLHSMAQKHRRPSCEDVVDRLSAPKENLRKIGDFLGDAQTVVYSEFSAVSMTMAPGSPIRMEYGVRPRRDGDINRAKSFNLAQYQEQFERGHTKLSKEGQKWKGIDTRTSVHRPLPAAEDVKPSGEIYEQLQAAVKSYTIQAAMAKGVYDF